MNLLGATAELDSAIKSWHHGTMTSTEEDQMIVETIKLRAEARKRLACLETKLEKTLTAVDIVTAAFRHPHLEGVSINVNEHGKPYDPFFRVGLAQEPLEWPDSTTMVSLYADIIATRRKLNELDERCVKMGI